MTKRTSYTRSPMLQAIYGAGDPGAPGAAYATPEHAGLTLRAGFLMDPGINTHPITRGVRYLKRVMCQELPSPDPILLAMRDDVKVDPLKMPNHERVAAITAAPACQTCHVKINPIGSLLESYDPVARKRTQESYLEVAKGVLKVSATHPLPGPVDVKLPGLAANLAGPIELVEAVARSREAQGCMSAYVMRQQQRRKETTLDQCALDEVSQVLAAGQPVLEAFVKSTANEDIFWRGL
jgi:hypothetical protein